MHHLAVTACFAPPASPTPPSALPWATQIDSSGVAALTATAPDPAESAAFLPAPPTAKPRGNRNLHLAPTQPARTIHGNYGANPRAENRYRLTLLRIARVDIALDRYQAHLPPAFAARLHGYPPVLMSPLRPRGGITAAEDRATRHAVTASLAPWHAAVTEAHSAAGLRAPAIRPSQGAPTPGPVAPFKPFRIDPPNREPAAEPNSTVPSKPSRIDPLNREPAAKLDSTVPFKPSRIDPLNREPMAKPAPTAPFKPFRIDPLNREPGAFPDPAPQPVHRLHEIAHTRESAQCAAHAEPAPQARNLCRR
jgi:hypothetical protein